MEKEKEKTHNTSEPLFLVFLCHGLASVELPSDVMLSPSSPRRQFYIGSEIKRGFPLIY